MSSNELALNDEKTGLLVFGNKTVGSSREDVFIQAGAHKITPAPSHRLNQPDNEMVRSCHAQ